MSEHHSREGKRQSGRGEPEKRALNWIWGKWPGVNWIRGKRLTSKNEGKTGLLDTGGKGKIENEGGFRLGLFSGLVGFFFF